MEILECSSRGDKRFSSFYAKIKVFGVYDSIENHYQLCKRFESFVPKTWKDAKGKQPTHININGHDYDAKYLTMYFKLLWCKYLDEHQDLVQYARTFDDYNDIFKGKSINCQADVIRQYIKNGRQSIFDECTELITLILKNKIGE